VTRTLNIVWRRLLDGGTTCPRCSGTERELEKAASALTAALEPLSISVVVEKREISRDVFERDPLRSNEILIDGRPLEEWLGARTGQSSCCDVCGPLECRTLEVAGETHETIPAELIVRAGMIAALELSQPANGGCCCPGGASSTQADSCCG
jgi:hypothetical protein